MKALINLKQPCFQCKESATDYSIWFEEGFQRYYCVINFAASPADKSDYDDNYKARQNMAVPILISPFSANTVKFSGDGIVAEPVSGDGQPHNLDLKMDVLKKTNGAILYVTGGTQKDWIKAQVVDKDNVIPAGPARDPYPNYPVLNQWIHKWGIIPNFAMDLTTPQAGDIPALMYLRVVLTTDNDSQPRLATLNYRLNEPI